jgi:hypothetical protein
MRQLAKLETVGSTPAYRTKLLWCNRLARNPLKVEAWGSNPPRSTMRIKSKCPQCGEIVSSNWKTSPLYLTCKKGHHWHPRQDQLSSVYVHKTRSEKDYLND